MTQEILTHQPHRVYAKLNWSDSFVEQDNLYADSAVFSCAPDISKAILHWRYGRVMGYGEVEYENRAQKELLDYYIKIEIDRPNDDDGFPQDSLNWYGIVVSDTRELDGPFDDDGTKVKAGTQKIMCLGLEYLLTRKVIDTSIVEDGSGGEKEINRAIAFNLGSGHDSSSIFWPNMGGIGSKGVTIFDDRLDGSETWSSRDILEYLLAYHPPLNENGDNVLGWKVADDSNALHLEWHKPMLRVQGHTLYDVLNMLIDRRRLSSWKVVVADSKPQIYVFTFNPSDIDLPDDKTIIANPEFYTWDFDTSALVRQPTLERDSTAQYAKVTARGERLGFCFTIAYDLGSLEKDWSSTLQTEYNTGAVGATGYSAADSFKKQSMNLAYRNTDKFKRAYRYFRVPPTWTALAYPTTSPVFPVVDAPTTSANIWIPGFRFESYLPFKTDITYGATITAEDLSATTGDTLAKSKKEFRRPFAAIYTGSRYELVDQLSKGDSNDEVLTNGRNWSCSLRMADDAPAIIVDVSGAPQHVIAADEFSAADSADGEDWPAELRWQTIYATVFMHGDGYAVQTWPDFQFPTTDDVTKTLIIDVPNMRLDYVAPLTVLGLTNAGEFDRTTNGGYIHDDRAKLLEIARVAYEWYSTSRQSFEVSEHNWNVFEVGVLITHIGNEADDTLEEVNCVVTQLAIDLRAGTANYKTSFGELDFARIL